MKRYDVALVLAFALFAANASADEIIVDGSKGDTIQGGIDQAVDGDTVIVLSGPGYYSGDGNEAIRFNGKRITLLGEGHYGAPVIDLTNSTQPAFIFSEATESAVVIDTFGVNYGDVQIQIDDCTPFFSNCSFYAGSTIAAGSGGMSASYCSFYTIPDGDAFNVDSPLKLDDCALEFLGTFSCAASSSFSGCLIYGFSEAGMDFGDGTTLDGNWVEVQPPSTLRFGANCVIQSLLIGDISTEDLTIQLADGCRLQSLRADYESPRLQLFGNDILVRGEPSLFSLWFRSYSEPSIDIRGDNVTLAQFDAYLLSDADQLPVIRVNGQNTLFTECVFGAIQIANSGSAGVEIESGDTTIRNCTLVGASCWKQCEGRWMAIRSNATAALRNSYVSKSDLLPALVEDGATVTVDYSDVVGSDGAFEVQDNGVLVWGKGNVDANLELYDCGGVAHSPLHNAGDPNDFGDGREDCGGHARICGGRIDIGAGEVQDRAFIAGDMNCDNRRDFDDIDGFVTALIGRAEYESQFPACEWLNGDMDHGGAVTFDDIDAFVSCLIDDEC